MDEDKLKRTVQLLKALADATRLRVLGLVAARPHTVEEIASALGVREPTVSHHLRKLTLAGLVQCRAEGNYRWYALDQRALERQVQNLLAPEALATTAAPPVELTWEERVLANYLDGEQRLEVIPAQRKKREVILRFLTDQFATETAYTERQVNDVIARHHPDFATLRRELIGGRWLTRDDDGRVYLRAR